MRRETGLARPGGARGPAEGAGEGGERHVGCGGAWACGGGGTGPSKRESTHAVCGGRLRLVRRRGAAGQEPAGRCAEEGGRRRRDDGVLARLDDGGGAMRGGETARIGRIGRLRDSKVYWTVEIVGRQNQAEAAYPLEP
jgi:hypothetical protein